MSHIFFIMSENKDVVPSMNPEERPDLQDYKSSDKQSVNTNTCQDCGKVFPSTEELTVHYRKIILNHSSWINTPRFIT
jgi:hypothetical protein